MLYITYLQVGYIILPLSLDQLSWNSYQQVSHVYTHRFVPQRHCKEHERRINKRNRRCVVRYTRRFISQSSLRRKSVCVNVALHVYFEAVQILIKATVTYTNLCRNGHCAINRRVTTQRRFLLFMPRPCSSQRHCDTNRCV